MSDHQTQQATKADCSLNASSQEVVTKHEKCETEEQIAELSTAKPTESTNAPTTYGSVDNEIWATITPQQNASLEALHQSMRLSRGTASTAVAVVSESEEKPPVGSDEWHRQRRENHKQVERRRRENINEGISEIARIVPGCEKNKGSILNRAAIYIRQLKDNEAATLEKWTLEKLLTDQAISELNRQVEVFKSELERVKLENTYLKRELESASSSELKSKKQKVDHTDLQEE
ncbi:hypothetical protein INT48_002859 [Thamnidium elegans]|uniref:BHLH domain-containing protein n=1 Tax=Thamnidium elegans TaxID=101142 RepID=A0A8H7SP88_9FUNG|nr:hypothetical protein INT48_002859 [Thamnidium elegans]